MKLNTQSKFFLLIIAALFGIIIFQKCSSNPIDIVTKHDTITTVTTEYKTITKTTDRYVPKIETVTKYIHDTSHVIDTAYVIGDYYSTYFYKDSLKLSDTLKICISDSVTKNKIKSRKVDYTLRLPVTTIIHVTPEKKYNIYGGFGIVGNKEGLNYIGPEVLVRTRTKELYGIGIGIDNKFRYNLNLKAYWRLK